MILFLLNWFCQVVSMEPDHSIPTSICILKVNIKCCTECQEKAMKKLRKIHEVDSVSYNAKKGLLTVSGNIDPMILMQKFAKWGRKAELYSFQKDKCNSCSCQNNVQDAKTEDLAKSSSDKSTNKFKKLFGSWFCKKDEEAKTSTSKKGVLVKSPGATKWHFPRTYMGAYGALRGPFGQFGPPPYGERPHYINHYTPMAMMFPRPGPLPVPPHYGYGSMPPPPHQYDSYRSRPPAPPRMNPMIHYNSYDDNNFYYP